jgi:glutamyl-tRNA synthetase
MSAPKSPLKSRFCPSPTGLMTLGNARTALFSYLLSHSPPFIEKSDQPTFLLRIEDTDRARSTVAFSENIMEDLKWLGLNWNEGVYYQSERMDVYNRYYQQLFEQKEAYYCFCTETELQLARRLLVQQGKAPRYAGTCRHLEPHQIQEKLDKGLKPAIRYRISDHQSIEFCDLIQGPKYFRAQDIGDFIIKKNDESPSFMFCNAIDDSLMGVSHVIRGEDHLTNTPRQLLILRSLDLAEPLYGHLPLIVGSDGKPLSKRNGSLSVKELRDQGFLPLAIINYLSRLGHHFEEDKIASLPSLAKHFCLKQVNRSPARFDYPQLLHWQKETLSAMTDAELIDWMSSCSCSTPEFIKAIRDNVTQYKDVEFWANQFFEPIDYSSIPEKDMLIQATPAYFETAIHYIKAHGLDKKHLFEALKKELNLKGPALFMPMRLAISGVSFGPELDKIFALLGKEEILKRLSLVLNLVKNNT